MLEHCLEFVWPTRCCVCDKQGALLCEQCQNKLHAIDQRFACPHCGAPWGLIQCDFCAWQQLLGKQELSFCQSLYLFDEVSGSIIRGYKDGGEQRLAGVIAHLMAQVFPMQWCDWAEALGFVPASSQSVCRRGFDHMHEIAQALSCELGIPCIDMLAVEHHRDQRAYGRRARIRQGAEHFYVLKGGTLSRLILIDDVCTTGATLTRAQHALQLHDIQTRAVSFLRA